MLHPQRTKYKKFKKGRIRSYVKSQCACKYTASRKDFFFGNYGLRALEGGRLTARQLEAARRALRWKLKRSGRLWLRIFPDIPVTKKPTDVRIGKGKGAVAFWTSRIQPGQLILELDGVSKDSAKIAVQSASEKLSIKTFFVERQETLL